MLRLIKLNSRNCTFQCKQSNGMSTMNEERKSGAGKMLVTMLLLAAWPASRASDWVQVGPAASIFEEDTVAAKYFVDKSSIVQSGALYKAWSLTSFARERTLDDGSPYLSVKTLNLYSCQEHTTTLRSNVYYADSMGKSAPVRSVRYEKFAPEDIVPDNAADHALRIVCAKYVAELQAAAAAAKAAAKAAAAAAKAATKAAAENAAATARAAKAAAAAAAAASSAPSQDGKWGK
jgi:hypothetical protein